MPRPSRSTPAKRPFDLEVVLRRVRAAVAGYADAAMFALRDGGYGTLFQQLVGCIISIRTRDETSLPVARQLFDRAPTPAAVAALSVDEIDAFIRPVTFHDGKARQIREIAQRTVSEFGGQLPADAEVLLSFRGVGPKCAHLALGVAHGTARISVDIHVHRVTNRWGLVHTKSPAATLAVLERVLPRRYWVEINRLLVPFGKHICTGVRPYCSKCPVLEYCQQVGVTDHR